MVVKINAYLTSFRVGFHRKSCACGVFVRMSFFVNLLTVSGSLDPRSARARAVERLFLNVRIVVKKCNFCTLFLHFLRHLDLISFARNAWKNKGQKKTRNLIQFGSRNRSQESGFLVSVSGFEGAPRWSQMVFLVPLGGLKGESQCSQGP